MIIISDSLNMSMLLQRRVRLDHTRRPHNQTQQQERTKLAGPTNRASFFCSCAEKEKSLQKQKALVGPTEMAFNCTQRTTHPARGEHRHRVGPVLQPSPGGRSPEESHNAAEVFSHSCTELKGLMPSKHAIRDLKDAAL